MTRATVEAAVETPDSTETPSGLTRPLPSAALNLAQSVSTHELRSRSADNASTNESGSDAISSNHLWAYGCVLLIAAAGSSIIAYFGWISDDALITFRYSQNFLDGHGPVFNLGDRVQGYTHPLWFIVLTISLWAIGNPIYVVTIVGTALTFITFSYLGTTLIQRAKDTRIAVLMTLLLAATLVASESWRSFQTGGLENPLTHLLLVLLIAELLRPAGSRVLVLSLTSALLILTRPDIGVLIGPLNLYLVFRAYRERKLQQWIVGMLPLLIWLLAAQLYYGDFLPNTASAKLGTYPLTQGLLRGTWYVGDWAYHEPVSLLATLFLGIIACRAARSLPQRLLICGVFCYLLYVVVIGGDFMRGRFMLPIFVTIAVYGVLDLQRSLESLNVKLWPIRRLVLQTVPVLIALAILTPGQTAVIEGSGIVNERLYYAGLHLRSFIKTGGLEHPAIAREFSDQLRAFRNVCGPFSIHAVAIGGVGFSVGSEISVVDLIGLTDEYIAGLGNENLVAKNHRPGHPKRLIPLRYLASRADISIFTDWRTAVVLQDCGIIAASRAFSSSPELYNAQRLDMAPSFFSPVFEISTLP